MKDTKRTQTYWKIYSILWLQESILLKSPYHLRESRHSMQSLSNYQWHFLKNNNKIKFIWKHKRPWIANTTLRKKNRTRGIRSLTADYTTKPQQSQTVSHWDKNRLRAREQNRAEEQTKTPSQLSQDKRGKTTQWRRHFFNKRCWENWILSVDTNKMRPFSDTIYKN